MLFAGDWSSLVDASAPLLALLYWFYSVGGGQSRRSSHGLLGSILAVGCRRLFTVKPMADSVGVHTAKKGLLALFRFAFLPILDRFLFCFLRAFLEEKNACVGNRIFGLANAFFMLSFMYCFLWGGGRSV